MADVAAIHAVYSDPEVMRHVGHGPVGGLAETEAALAAYIEHQERHGFSFWAVVERRSGALIGDAGLYSAGAAADEIELGYTLGAARWGRGYATEAARACLDVGFRELELDEILAVADPANSASVHVLDKLGMVAAGRRRAYGRAHLLYRLRRAAYAA